MEKNNNNNDKKDIIKLTEIVNKSRDSFNNLLSRVNSRVNEIVGHTINQLLDGTQRALSQRLQIRFPNIADINANAEEEAREHRHRRREHDHGDHSSKKQKREKF